MIGSLIVAMGDIFSFVANHLLYLIEIVLMVGGIALYLYSLFEAALPKLVSTPLVAILIAASVGMYCTQTATLNADAQCALRIAQDQQDANKKQLEAALQIKTMQQQLDTSLTSLKVSQASQSLLLNQAIANPEDDTPPPTDTIGKTDAPPPASPPIVSAKSCLDLRVPANIVRALR